MYDNDYKCLMWIIKLSYWGQITIFYSKYNTILKEVKIQDKH